ncbi:phospholipase A1 VesT1.02-like [Diorhabda sublineata]|uniref:phospholipase A1 VesT1.02-like n=1 Tax=Diorhabda sublineata TaxID=1163346 RepID=UPI0024E046BE|nr:phospholipase A1 VesT1.02-like [Diorhabda sublineata]
MIHEFATNGVLNLNRSTLCGHSFGAIIAGHIGSLLNGRAGQAIGLDPTSKLISFQITFKGMTKSSAQYVQIIHTDFIMGDIRELGTADFYVNGGIRQPKCGLDFGEHCSHLSAIDYYVESILMNDFIAKKCSNYLMYIWGLCESNTISCMGGYHLDTKARGKYYVETNLKPPYGKGECSVEETVTKMSL